MSGSLSSQYADKQKYVGQLNFEDDGTMLATFGSRYGETSKKKS
jgi:hypothetical protein